MLGALPAARWQTRISAPTERAAKRRLVRGGALA